MTVYLGAKFTVNPVTLAGLSTSKALSGIANFPDGAFSVARTYHDVRIAGTSTNGLMGGYNTYEVTALQVGVFTITGGATVCTKVGHSVGVGGSNYWAEETQYNSFTLTVTVKPVPVVTQIIIPSSVNVTIGDTYTFSPQIIQEGATTTLTWKSSNTSVATVNSSGKVTAKTVGTANITCTATNGVSATCKVTVTPILVTGVSLNKTSATVNCGSTLQLTATVTPSNATNKNVNWKSSNTNVATVNSSGLVTAKTPGQCTITATAADGSGKSASCTVTVKPVLITDITLNQTESELFLGEKLQLTATISPSNATNKTLTWISSNDHVATVNESGMVSSVASGQCIITVSANDDSGKKATCKVTVVNDILSIDDAVAVPSGTMTLPVYMKNESQITGLQFDLQVPDGVTVAESNNQFIANMSDRAVDQSISGTNVSDNLYRFVVFSPTSKAFSGNEGAIAYITLNMDGNMTVGEYDLMLKGIELTKTDGTSIHHKDMTSKLTLTDVKMGDTNGDGTVTVTDAVGIVNTILGHTPSVFISKAADVDGNGSVTISDAVGIINMILNKQ